jgi:hypothetical protein
MACVVASITRPEDPWRSAGFQEEAVQKDRIETVQRLIESNLKDVLKRSPLVKQEYVSKRRYIATQEKTVVTTATTATTAATADGTPVGKELIPPGFLPEMGLPAVAVQGEQVVPLGDRGKARAWIQMGNSLAQRTAKDATCCLAPLANRDAFWVDLPAFPTRFLSPSIRVPSQQVAFEPRTPEVLTEVIRDDFMYQLFLKVCYEGPNQGRPHEVSLTHECTLCGLVFPMPPSLMTHEEGKTATLALDTSPEAFQHLLDTVHRLNAVEPVAVKRPDAWAETLSDLSTLDPPPLPSPLWRDTLENMFIELNRMNPAEADQNPGELARICGPLSEQVRTAKTAVFRQLAKYMTTPAETQGNMALVAGLPWSQFTQVLETHLLAPFQKLLTKFDSAPLTTNDLFKHKSMDPFAPAHTNKLREIIQEENKTIKYFAKQFAQFTKQSAKDKDMDYVSFKLRYSIRQLSAVLAFKNRIRARYFVGSALTFQWIQQAILYGIFAEFLNISSIHKEEGEETPAYMGGEREMVQLVGVCVNLFKKQQLTYDDEKLRLLIQARNEKEAIAIVRQTVEMTDEERAIDSLNRRLGLGKWAVGGTKVIFQYDPDYWMREAAEREAAGIEDDTGLVRPPTEEELDAEEGGYDHGRDEEDE